MQASLTKTGSFSMIVCGPLSPETQSTENILQNGVTGGLQQWKKSIHLQVACQKLASRRLALIKDLEAIPFGR